MSDQKKVEPLEENITPDTPAPDTEAPSVETDGVPVDSEQSVEQVLTFEENDVTSEAVELSDISETNGPNENLVAQESPDSSSDEEVAHSTQVLEGEIAESESTDFQAEITSEIEAIVAEEPGLELDEIPVEAELEEADIPDKDILSEAALLEEALSASSEDRAEDRSKNFEEIVKKEAQKKEPSDQEDEETRQKKFESSLFQVEYKKQEQVMSRFVPPQGYKAVHLQGFANQNVFIIHGPKYAGKFTCAVHLGLVLQGKIPALTEDKSSIDLYTIQEIRANELIKRIGPDHPKYNDLFSQKYLLDENLQETRQYLDTRDLKVERAQIISRLNQISLSVLSTQFDQLYQPNSGTTGSFVITESNSALRLKIYTLPESESQSIPILINQQAVQDNTIYIIENFPQKGFSLGELSDSFFSTLREKSIYLILTTIPQELERLTLLPQVCAISAYNNDRSQQIAFMEEIFAKYRDAYQAAIPTGFTDLTPKDVQSIVQEHLHWPYLVEIFYESAIDLPTSADRQEILKLAEQVGRPRQIYTRHWFENLPNNVKLYAMLVVLIEGISAPYLNEIYIQAVNLLRHNGVENLDDPREHGFEDILKLIKASRTAANGPVRLTVPAFEREVRQQIRNYHHLLWSLMELLVEYIEAYKAAEHWQFRKMMGGAIGRMGIYQIPNLETLLEQLAKHSSGGVVAVVGNALDEVCAAGPEYYAFVYRLLNRWASSGDPDLMWAVGSSIWRIYDGLAEMSQIDDGRSLETQQTGEMLEEVRQIFTKLIKNFDRFSHQAYQQALEKDKQLIYDEGTQTQNLTASDIKTLIALHTVDWAANIMGSILHAIRQIALTHSEDIVALIEDLLQKENENLHRIGLLAGRELFERNTLSERRPSKNKHLPLLELISPLLSFEEDPEEKVKTVKTFIEALLTWLKYPEWPEPIHTTLLGAVNHATLEEANILCNSLSQYWLDSGSKAAQRIGQALIARAYAIHGIPMDSPGKRYGIIMTDASYQDQRSQISAIISRQLYERLDVQVDTAIVRMGNNKKFVSSDSSVSVETLLPEYSLPRVLIPALEPLNPDDVHFVLIISWGEIIDLEDLLDGPWSARLIIASANRRVEWPKDIEFVPFNAKNTDLAAIEIAVRAQLAQSLTTLTPEARWSSLQNQEHFEGLVPDEIETIIARLETWMRELDNIAFSRHPGDIVRTILCTMLWLASSNLPECIRRVKGWLTDKNEQKKLVGGACAMALFRVYAHADPLPPVQTHALLLKLALPLVEIRWHAIYAVLYAARKWAMQPDWAERLIAKPDRKSSEFMKFIEAIVSDHYDDLINHLKQEWVSEEGAEDPPPESVEKVLSRIHLHMAIGARRSLPELEAEHAYGLIIVDTNSYSKLFDVYINIASQLCKKLDKIGHESIHLLTYHLGYHYPVSTPDEEPKPNDLIPVGSYRRPRLLGSLLEIHSPDQISFVLLLTQDLAIDEEDWYDTPWRDKVYAYSHTTRPLDTQLVSQIPRDAKDPTLKIIDYLQENIGG